MEQRSRGVSDGDHRALQIITPQRHRGCGAGGSPLIGQHCCLLITQKTAHLVVGGKAPTGNAGVDHVRIDENRRSSLQGPACCGHPIGMEDNVSGQVEVAGGMDHAHHHPGLVGSEGRQVRPFPDDTK